jgi:hypothetical protein
MPAQATSNPSIPWFAQRLTPTPPTPQCFWPTLGNVTRMRHWPTRSPVRLPNITHWPHWPSLSTSWLPCGNITWWPHWPMLSPMQPPCSDSARWPCRSMLCPARPPDVAPWLVWLALSSSCPPRGNVACQPHQPMLFSRCHLLLLQFFHHCHAHAAFLIVLQAGESGLTLLPPCSCPGKEDLEAAAANPKGDGACGYFPLFLGSAFQCLVASFLSLVGQRFLPCGCALIKLVAAAFVLSMRHNTPSDAGHQSVLSGRNAIDACKEDLMGAFNAGIVGVPVKGGDPTCAPRGGWLRGALRGHEPCVYPGHRLRG